MSGTIDNPASWSPPGETAADLWLERSNFAGITLSSVAYGVHLTLYLIVLQHLVQNPTRKKHSWGLIAYITWNFILGTFGIASEARFNQIVYIDARNYPGGPNAFVAQQYGIWINIFGTAAYIVLNWFADGMVIYRFWLIYSFNYYILIVPSVLLLGSFCMGVILLFQISQPNANLWTTTAVNFAIPYWSISAGLNILVTSMIVARLLYVRNRTRRALSSQHARTYTSVASMLIESAALYSVTALIFIITYARNSEVQNLVLPVLGQVQAVSPLLIMWRVARGQAWTRETVQTASKMTWARSKSSAPTTRATKSSATVAPVPMGTFSHTITFDSETNKSSVADRDSENLSYAWAERKGEADGQTDGHSDQGVNSV